MNVSVANTHSFVSCVCSLTPHHKYLKGPYCICGLLQWRAGNAGTMIRILYHFQGVPVLLC